MRSVAREKRRTYSYCSGLNEETDKVETHFPVRGEGDTSRNHEHDYRELLVRVLDAECPGN